MHAAYPASAPETSRARRPGKADAAEIKKSVKHDGIVSFEDGKTYKTMRRHLTMRGLTPEAYRAKYGLPADYPMTSAAYSAQRSELARASVSAISVGRQLPRLLRRPRRSPRPPSPADGPEGCEGSETAPKGRGHKKVAETA